ncbi:MAG: hypothetical protein QG602_4212 [Verrucomicrobiota bacterium]|nr:hypothetical protein [Verrucomicrobiota bacterium]
MTTPHTLRNHVRFPRIAARLPRVASLAALLAVSLPAQQTAPENPQQSEETLRLSPYQVTASTDLGYLARSTLAGSRLNTDLRDVASQISVMTPEFLADVSATTLDDAMRYSLNYENPWEFTNATANNGDFHRGIIQDNAATRTRSLSESVYMHDFFVTYMPMDTYNTERFTVASGPNAILFGLGSAAGAVDSTYKRAQLAKNAYEFSLRVDSEDSWRTILDVNTVLWKDKLAVRFVGLGQNQHTFRKPNNNEATRLFTAVTFQPFKNTRIRGWYEDAELLRQLARNAIIVDRATPWINAGRPAFNNAPGFISPAANNLLFSLNGNQGMTYLFGQTAPGTIPVQNLRNTTVFTRGVEATRPSPDNVDVTLADRSLFPIDVNYQGNATNNDTYGHIAGAAIEQTFFDKLFVEAAFNKEVYQANFSDLIRGVETELYVDANQFLPGGTTPNPNYGRYFIEGSGRAGIWWGARDDLRLSASYELDLSERTSKKWLSSLLGRHRLSGLVSREELHGGTNPTQTLQGHDAYIISDTPLTVGRPQDNTNRTRQLRFRAYLDDPKTAGANGVYHANLPFYALGNTTLPDGTQIATIDNPYGATASATRSLTRIDSNVFAVQSYFWDGRVVTTFGFRKDKQRRANVTTARVGVPTPTPTTAYTGLFQHFWEIDPGENWNPADYVVDHSRSRGIVVHPTKWLSLFYSDADTFGPSGNFHQPDDSVIPGTRGEGRDYGFTLSLFDDRLYFRANKYRNTNAPNSSAFRDSVRDLFINIERVIHARFPADKDGVYDPNLPRDYYNVTSDQVAEGYEFELTANPTPQWRLTLNASKPDSVESGIGAHWLEALDRRLPVWTKYGNELLEGSTTRTVRDEFRDRLNSVNTMKESDGTATQQLRTWRMNLITRYSFTEGFLKRFHVGGVYSWRGKSVLGYKNKTIANQYPFPGIDAQIVVPDLAQPVYGRATTTIDLFAGYGRRLFKDRIDWSIQLNIRNAFDDDDPIVQRVLSDGTTRFYTVPEPRALILTNTFKF